MERKELSCCGGNTTGVATMENYMGIPQKIKYDVIQQFHSLVFTQSIKPWTQKDICTCIWYMYSKEYVHFSIIFNSQNIETIQVSTDVLVWMKKDVVYTHMGILSYKQEGNLSICDNIDDLKGIMLDAIHWGKTNIAWSHWCME